ncbi:MAG: hypothetical protein AAF661_15080 [Pseudomonadota bacterium]
MAEKIDEVFVQINARTGDLEQGLRQAQTKARQAAARMSDSFTRATKGVTDFANGLNQVRAAVGLLATGGGLSLLIRGAVNLGNALRTTSRDLGVTSDALQELQFVALRTGGSIEDAQSAIQALNGVIDDFFSGGERGRQVFEGLGLAAQLSAGEITNSEQAFLAIRQALSEIEDPTERAERALQIFGRNLTRRLLPALELSKEEFDALRVEARETGFVMSQDLVEATADLNDALERLSVEGQRSFAAFFVGFRDEILGALDLLAAFIARLREARDLVSVGLGGGVSQQTLIEQARQDVQAASALVRELEEGGERYGLTLAEANSQLAEAEDRLRTLSSLADGEGAPEFIRPPRSDDDGRGGSGSSRVQKTLEDLLDESRERSASLQAETAALIRGTEALSEYEEQTRILTAAKQAGVAIDEEAIEKINEVARIYAETSREARDLQDAMELLVRTEEQSLSNQELLEREIQRILDLRDELVAITNDEAEANRIVAEAIRQLKEEYGEFNDIFEQLELAGDAFAQVLSDGLRQAVRDMAFAEDRAKALENTFRAMLFRLGEILLEVALFQPFENAAGGLIGGLLGGFGGSSSNAPSSTPRPTPRRELGGPVEAGQAYLVGEQRPEVFVPRSPGTIVPSVERFARMAGQPEGRGDGVSVQQTLNISSNAESIRSEVTKMLPAIREDTKRAVLEGTRRGGSFAKGVRGRG